MAEGEKEESKNPFKNPSILKNVVASSIYNVSKFVFSRSLMRWDKGGSSESSVLKRLTRIRGKHPEKAERTDVIHTMSLRNSDLLDIEERWASLDNEPKDGKGKKGLRQKIIETSMKLGPYLDWGYAEYKGKFASDKLSKIGRGKSRDLIETERRYLEGGSGLAKHKLKMFMEKDGENFKDTEDTVEIEFLLPKRVPFMFPDGTVYHMPFVGRQQLEASQDEGFTKKVQQSVEKMRDAAVEYWVKKKGEGNRSQIENNMDAIRSTFNAFIEGAVNGKYLKEEERYVKLEDPIFQAELKGKTGLATLEGLWRKYLGEPTHFNDGESLLIAAETLRDTYAGELDQVRPENTVKNQGKVVLPKGLKHTYKVIRPFYYELVQQHDDTFKIFRRQLSSAHFSIKRDRGEYTARMDPLSKYDWILNGPEAPENLVGLDGNGMPLEVTEHNSVFVDVLKGDTVPRTVPKEFVRSMPLYQTATYIHNLWDSFRDDCRDGRYHWRSTTAYDYAIAQSSNPHFDTRKNWWSFDQIRSRKQQWRVKEENRNYEMELYDGSILKGMRIPTNLSPSFDLRGLSARWQHPGRVYYYDYPQDALSMTKESEEAGAPLAGKIDPGMVSTRGSAMFVRETLRRELFRYDEFKDEWNELTSEIGADYGIRKGVDVKARGKEDLENLKPPQGK